MAIVKVGDDEYESLDFTGPRAALSLLGDRKTMADSQDAYCVGARAVLSRPKIKGAGLCGCGCGKATEIATCNDPVNGKRKGKPLAYCKGHEPRAWKLCNR